MIEFLVGFFLCLILNVLLYRKFSAALADFKLTHSAMISAIDKIYAKL